MDIYEQINRLDELINYVNNELPIFAQNVAAADLAALVTNRVVQKGENYKGGQFSPYSTQTVAAWRFWGKSRTQAAEKKVRAQAKAKGALSYKTFRELNNLKAGAKNFEFTGEMWRKFGIVSTIRTGPNFKIKIGGTTTAAQDKIDENSAREGLSIVEASEKERQIVQQTAQGWLNRQANRILNNE